MKSKIIVQPSTLCAFACLALNNLTGENCFRDAGQCFPPQWDAPIQTGNVIVIQRLGERNQMPASACAAILDRDLKAFQEEGRRLDGHGRMNPDAIYDAWERVFQNTPELKLLLNGSTIMGNWLASTISVI